MAFFHSNKVNALMKAAITLLYSITNVNLYWITVCFVFIKNATHL